MLIDKTDTLPMSNLSEDQLRAAKKTVIIIADHDGERYQMEFDASVGCIVMIDQPDPEKIEAIGLCSDSFFNKALHTMNDIMRSRDPLYAAFSSMMEDIIGTKLR